MARHTPRRRGPALRPAALLAAYSLAAPVFAQQTPPAPVAITPPPAPVAITPPPAPVAITPPPAPVAITPPPAPVTITPPAPVTITPPAPVTITPPAPVTITPPAPVTITPPPAEAPDTDTLSPLEAPTVSADINPAHNLLTRLAALPMGTNNGVRVWAKGDGSGALLWVRLAESITPSYNTALRPYWMSAPIPVTWTGWKLLLVPRKQFTLRGVPSQAQMVNTDLPADAQSRPVNTIPRARLWRKIDTLTLETRVKSRAQILVDDIAFVTIDTSNAVTSETSVDDFENGNVAAWTPSGPSAQQNALVYGLAAQPGQAHGGRVAFRLTITSPDAARQGARAALSRALALSGKPYQVFTPASLFNPVLPTTLPGKGASSLLSVRACPDQTQAATFCLYSAKALSNVSVTVPGDLQALGHVFSRANIDVRVVKVWTQYGAGPLQDPDTAALVPELLVKDDRVPLAGIAPAMRLAGAPVTAIPADTTKQFWVTITVPSGTFPTRYTGSLRVTATGLAAPATVPVDITVLPLRLLSSAKQYAINLRSRLDPVPAALPADDGTALPTDFVDKDTLDKQLADIYAHSVRIPTLYDAPATLAQAVTEYRASRMGEPYLYRGTSDPLTVETARKATPAAPFVFYDSDNPQSATGPYLASLVTDKLTPAGYVTSQADYAAIGSALGVALYSRDSDYAQQLIRTKGLRTSQTRDWWYWPASNEDPLTNRLDTGYLLWRANLYGAFLPAYQTAFGDDPYDETSAGAPDFLAAYRPQMLTYPVKGGVLDTLQWEAVREGITDTRYLTTMYAALREAKDAHISKALVASAEGYVKAFLDKPLAGLPETELDTARTQIATYALQLRTAVDAYNKKNGIKP